MHLEIKSETSTIFQKKKFQHVSKSISGQTNPILKKIGDINKALQICKRSTQTALLQLNAFKSYLGLNETFQFRCCLKMAFLHRHPHPLVQFMEDGAPAHRAKSTQEWHQKNGVRLFQGWPGNSPDLNIIENLWSQMKHLQRTEQATSKQGLKKIARRVWNAITPEYLEKLYESLPRRMAAVIASKGAHTKY